MYACGYFQDLIYLSGQNFSLTQTVILPSAVYPRWMNRECRRLRLTCNRDTRYHLSESTISDASGGNRDIGFRCRSQLLENSVNERFYVAPSIPSPLVSG